MNIANDRPALCKAILGSLVVMLLVLTVGCSSSAPKNAPEAGKILTAQASMPFQILIPAYLPNAFDRANVVIDTSQIGAGGEPMVQLTYPTAQGEVLFIREWLPVNPGLEILSESRPIVTKWGQGWMLSQGLDLATIWVDIGPLRVSVYTRFLNSIKLEQILEVADTMGPASDQQVFSFVVNAPSIRQAAPPPPLEIKPDANGVQQVTLVVTPGGYSPLRFSVKKGLLVRLIFKQLGDVGCGNELIFPSNPANPVSVKLKSRDDQQVIEFTPQQDGSFEFYCAHQMYRGVMTVHD
jgi:hypothetical protein